MAGNSALVIDIRDNVAVALKDLKKWQKIKIIREDCVIEMVLVEDIPVYHKFALTELNEGDKIFKYGEVIGIATCTIKAGEHAHTHNIASLRG